MAGLLAHLGVELPVVAAPMAGGPTTPALVHAAADAGGLGFLAAGYLAPEALAEQVRQVRGAGVPYAVNVFAPNPVPVDPAAYRAYAQALQVEAERYGLDLTAVAPVEDDDAFEAKVDLLVAEPVPLVSFTFGVPDVAVVARLRAVGTVVLQTVTAPAEAVLAADAGVDGLVVQGFAAGAHSGTLTPQTFPAELPLTELLHRVRAVTSLPVVAGGGLATADDVRAVLAAGAEAAMVGTALLRTPESGASSTYKQALAQDRGDPVLTRAFTGRPARGLPNRLVVEYGGRAPVGYPAVHHLTRPLRRAAAEAGDPELVNLWAGTGYRLATDEPTAVVLRRLAGEPPQEPSAKGRS